MIVRNRNNLKLINMDLFRLSNVFRDSAAYILTIQVLQKIHKHQHNIWQQPPNYRSAYHFVKEYLDLNLHKTEWFYDEILLAPRIITYISQNKMINKSSYIRGLQINK